ncbi:MAG: acetylxylan esterase, partial [Anaerolineae bacterium]|nr:acetylxylan esterase [Anaerolineae bacterium]
MTSLKSVQRWSQARRQAFWQRLYGTLGLIRQPAELLSFEDVQGKLRLNENAYRGLQQVPLDQIVGSVGRYNDFTRTFLPLVESDRWRWQRIAELQEESGLPPIELYRVGDAYFVKDGNHRVSVAQQFGMRTIEAYVWEYQSPVGGLSPDTRVDDLIIKAEYRAFLDWTQLDRLRPDQDIVLTEPGMYPALQVEIGLYRENLEQIDNEARSIEEAATAWYDLVYTLAVDTIRDSDVLDLFPGRTEADLYIWSSRHREELSDRYGEAVSLRDAVSQLVEERLRPGGVGRMMQSVAHSVTGLLHSLSPGRADATQELPALPPADEPLGRLLIQVNNIEPAMAYSGQRGDEWRAWRSDLRDKLWELLGMTLPTGDVEASIDEQVVLSGVERVRLLITAADGLQLPAYLMRPADVDEPLPALLVYPGHGTIRQTAGLDDSPHRANALALAQAGFVTLTVEARGIGELGQIDHLALDSIARLVGRTWLGMVLEDGQRALDYLQSRPDVKPEHLGVTGLGLGGGLALYTAALDERARVVVIENYVGGNIHPMPVLGHGCDFVPNLRRYAEL